MSTPTSSHSRKGGFTLIEVAIALALFVIGALAIVRIFPPALSVIRNNESRVTATRMGESTLAKMPVSAPDAVFDGVSDNWNDIVYSVVGTPTKNNSLPASPITAANDLGDVNSPVYKSALGHFRYIRGEKQQLRATTTQQFFLLNYPCSTTNAYIYEEDEIEGVQIDDDGNLDFSGATRSSNGSAFNDTSGGFPSRAPEAMRGDYVTYYVTYRWRYTGQRPKGVIDEPLKMPVNSNWTGQSGKVLQGVMNSSNHIIPGGVTVRIRQLKGYAIPNNNDAARGYINLNAGYTTDNSGSGSTLNLTTGKTYKIDYIVADWRNMVDDSAPTATGAVSLPIKNLDETVPVYGFLTQYNSTNNLVVSANETPATDYKNGVATYTSAVGQIKPRTRTVYRTLDNWAHQLSVAAKSYIPYYRDSDFSSGTRPGIQGSGLLPIEAWREYYWTPTDPNNVYFHAGEAGKSVALSFEYQSGGTYRTISNAILTIGDDLIDLPGNVPAGFAPSGKVARMELADLAGNLLPSGAEAILSVQGISVRARTAWLNNDRYNQVIVPGYRSLTHSN